MIRKKRALRFRVFPLVCGSCRSRPTTLVPRASATCTYDWYQMTGCQILLLSLHSLLSPPPLTRPLLIRVNDTSLYGPARCESAADVDNPFNACVLKGWENGVNEDGKPVVNRIFDKVCGRPLSSTCVFGTRRGLCYTKRIGFSHINFEGVVADVW